MITVKHLSMNYKAPIKQEGLQAAIASLFHREYRSIQAVHDISFSLAPGEVVGFIGPNGAGKTTTLKILSGILHPSGGDVRILQHIPWQRENTFLKSIALIRGSQPIGGPGELTVLDSLRFQQLIYEVSPNAFRKNLHELTNMLTLDHLLHRQIRTLSLGERMRCGLAHSLLYRPRILFLDEPTIGLDVTAINMVRRFILDYSQQTGATILLTSHYMNDVETLCKRIILIDQGLLKYDGNLDTLSTTLSPYKLIKITTTATQHIDWSSYGEVVAEHNEQTKITLRTHHTHVPAVATRLLAEQIIIDLSIENPPLENVIDQVYREGIA